MSLSILGIGTAVPDHTMTQDEALAMSTELICRTDRETRLLRMMFRKAGVKKRHTCVPHRIAYQWVGNGNGSVTASESPGPTTLERMQLYAAHAAPLAIQASVEALTASGVSAAEITHLVTVSCTGFDAPGVDISLIEQLGLPNTVQRVHVGFMGCHGAINGLRTALAFSSRELSARVLLCAVELCSLHFHFRWDAERILGNALFADGAGALVVGQTSEGDRALCHLLETGSRLFNDSKDTITWAIGDHGYVMSLSNQVPALIGKGLAPWLESWLASQGHSLSSIQSWAVHPGGPRILDAVEEALDLDGTAVSVSREILAEYGNMSSPTILFILQRLLRRNAPRPCVALGFGPGLMAEAALIN